MDLRITEQITIDGVVVPGVEQTYTANGGLTAAYTWASAPTDYELDLPVDVSTVDWLVILSDKDATLETNAIDATGGQVIALYANKPLVWRKEGATPYFTRPTTPDIEKFYLTAVATAGTLKMWFGVDVTPA